MAAESEDSDVTEFTEKNECEWSRQTEAKRRSVNSN